jgi:sec-independent protein translocase protein TatA
MHLVIILGIVLLIFGPGKLPDMGSAIGKAIRGFKKEMEDPEKKSGDGTDSKKN